MPQRAAETQRHYLRQPPGYGGQHAVSGGQDGRTGALLGDATSCAMCRRQVINAGIGKVVIRKTDTGRFEVVDVQDWVQQEDDVPAL